MWHTVNDPDGAGHAYYIEGYDIIGKTGTAQIASTNGEGYLTGDKEVIRSIALMFPKDDPEIIIYGAVKRSTTVSSLSEPVKEIIQNIAKYYNIYNEPEDEATSNKEIKNYINEETETVKEELQSMNITPIILGSGDVITDQYPINTTISNSEKVFLITNQTDYVLPDLTGYSRSDLETLFTFLNISYTIKGNGYLKSQSIKSGTKITPDMHIEVALESEIKNE